MLRKWLVVLVSALELSALAIVRTEVLADGWMFRLKGESEVRPVRVPHDWGIEKGFLKAGSCPAQGDLPFVGKVLD